MISAQKCETVFALRKQTCQTCGFCGYTVCPVSSDPFYIASFLYKMGHYLLDILYIQSTTANNHATFPIQMYVNYSTDLRLLSSSKLLHKMGHYFLDSKALLVCILDASVSANLYCNSRTSVFERFFLRLLMQRSVAVSATRRAHSYLSDHHCTTED